MFLNQELAWMTPPQTLSVKNITLNWDEVFFKNCKHSPFFFFFPELHYCTGAYRISPVDVNSRPSSCLTNFLLNGKTFCHSNPQRKERLQFTDCGFAIALGETPSETRVRFSVGSDLGICFSSKRASTLLAKMEEFSGVLSADPDFPFL